MLRGEAKMKDKKLNTLENLEQPDNNSLSVVEAKVMLPTKPFRHLDLFSGIGGFALAVDRVWPNSEHIFVENDDFCTQVLKKHWPNATFHGDIRQFITDTDKHGFAGWGKEINASQAKQQAQRNVKTSNKHAESILTGGFPCQPFSQAGRRKGTADDRYIWKEMLECISLFRPRWVIAENVAGLVTWNEGLVLETVCA